MSDKLDKTLIVMDPNSPGYALYRDILDYVQALVALHKGGLIQTSMILSGIVGQMLGEIAKPSVRDDHIDAAMTVMRGNAQQWADHKLEHLTAGRA